MARKNSGKRPPREPTTREAVPSPPGPGSPEWRDEVGKSGVYPMSGPLPEGDAEVRTPAEWGQGDRGAEGYEDHGDSETHVEGAQGSEPDTPHPF